MTAWALADGNKSACLQMNEAQEMAAAASSGRLINWLADKVASRCCLVARPIAPNVLFSVKASSLATLQAGRHRTAEHRCN